MYRVDALRTLRTLLTMGDELKPGVSVDMRITYMQPANIGEEILIEAVSIRLGRTLAFLVWKQCPCYRGPLLSDYAEAVSEQKQQQPG